MYPREIGGSSNKNPDLDRAKLSSRPTPETSRSSGGMRPSDRASTSDGSRSELDKVLDITRRLMIEKQEIADKLEQANEKIQKLTEERDNLGKISVDLTNKLELANQKIEELANQLKQTRSGETSSPQGRESNPKRELALQKMQEWMREKSRPWEKEEKERSKHKKSWWQ